MGHVVKKIRCPVEGCDTSEKGDNLAVYENNSGKCYACNYHTMNVDEMKTIIGSYRVKSINEIAYQQAKRASSLETLGPPQWIYADLKIRKIPKDLCEKWGVLYNKNYNGQKSLAFIYYEPNREIGCYHVKPLDKKCMQMGNAANCQMYGEHLQKDPDGKYLVITEGHEDCISVSKVIHETWGYVTTLPQGTGSVENFVKWHYQKLTRYKGIVLCFDSRPDGLAAAHKFIKLFNQVGKIKIATLPLKDANLMDQEGRLEELKWAIIKADTFRPPTAVEVKDVVKKALTPPKKEWEWPWETMNLITHGGRTGEIHLLAGPPGTGKTSVIQAMYKKAIDQGKQIGLISLEQAPEETLQKIVGNDLNIRLDLNEEAWKDSDDIENHMMSYQDKLYLYDKRNGADFENIIQTVHYWVNAKNVSLVVLDNLKALCVRRIIDGKRVGEYDYLSYIGEKIYELVMQLPVTFIIASHMTKDTIQKTAYVSTSPKNADAYNSMTATDVNKKINKHGMTWSSGRLGSPEHVYGANTLEAFANYLWILARNKESTDDLEHRTLNIKCGKARRDSRNESKIFSLLYDHSTALYSEIPYEGANE